jgi:hypothetical protein
MVVLIEGRLRMPPRENNVIQYLLYGMMAIATVHRRVKMIEKRVCSSLENR